MMSEMLVALVLLSTLSPVQTTDAPKQIPFTLAKPGEKLTLTCPNLWDKPGLFYWYKMKSGHMLQTVAAGAIDTLSLQGQFNNSRFLVTKGDSLYYLTIKNVSKEDKATYICQAGSAYSLQFIGGTIVAVNDIKDELKSFQLDEETQVEAKGEPVIIILGILLGLCLIVIAVFILSRD